MLPGRPWIALVVAALVSAPVGAFGYQFSVTVLAPTDKALLISGKVMLIGRIDDAARAAEVKYLVDGQGLRAIPVKAGGFSQVVNLSPGKHEIKVSAVGHNAHTLTVTVDPSPRDPDTVYKTHPGVAENKCGDCHDARSKGTIGDLTVCAASCHGDQKGGKFLHGPIGSGQCIPCHDPHGSVNKRLLKGEDKELCFLCHNAEDVEPHYRETKKLRCLNCHDPHGSDKKFILK